MGMVVQGVTWGFGWCGGGLIMPGVTGFSPVLGDILQASDNLSRVINSYKTVVEGQVVNGEVVTSAIPDSEGKVFWFPAPSRAARVPTARSPPPGPSAE